MSLQHIVLFKFPRELTADEDAKLRAMVASWPELIGTMTKVRLGTDLTGARTRGYSHLLYTEFPDFDTMTAYRAHPVHVEFLSFVSELGCEPLAFDYVLDSQTVLMPE
jgi:Stress responsive A/B Barrel Domain